MGKNLPANVGDPILSLGWEDPLQRAWQPTPVFLPGKPQGQRSLVGLDTTEVIYLLGLSDQFSSVAQSCLTLRDPMDHRTPGLPVHPQLPESTQTHLH